MVGKRQSMKKKLILLALTLFFASCSDDFDPRSYLNRFEVLALKQTADVIYLGQNSTLSVTPITYVPEKNKITEQSWSICPFSKGSRSDYDCAIKACETKETPKQDGLLTKNLATLFSPDCFKEIAERTKNISTENSSDSSKKFQPKLALIYQAKTDGREERRAVLELPIDFPSFAPPFTAPKRKIVAPQIKDVKLKGSSVFSKNNPKTLEKEKEFTLEVNVISGTDSLEKENPDTLVYFYSTMGKFEEGILVGTKVKTTWTLDTYGLTNDKAHLYIVVRDKNGGQDTWDLKFPVK